MGSPKLTVTNDGAVTSVAYTNDTQLPPMIFVGVNEALAEVPPNATWLSKTDYKFEHVIDAEEMKTAQFIEEVLSWISLRLQTCDWQRMSSPGGPCHGALTEAWKSQESIIMDWSDDPMGLEEQWAQIHSELFAGITYDGLAAYSMGDGFGDAWEEYIYSRLQTEYLEHAKVTKQVVVDQKTNKVKTVTTGRSVISWEDPRQRVIVDEAEDKARVWKTNDDPASPMVAACQHLATLGLVTRGFRIELAKKELQPSIDMMGLSAAPAFGSPVFGSPGKWLWRGDNDVTNVAKMCAESPPLAPGSVYTYHSHHQLAFTEVIVGKALVKDGADPSASLRARIEAATGKVSSKVPDAITGIEKKDQADFDALPDKTGYSIRPVTVKWQGQGKGSHIFHVLRVHKDKTRVQLFDAGGGGNSREPMENEKDVNGRSLGRGLVLESGLGSNMDTCAYTTIYSNDAGPPNGVGIPIPKQAPDLQKQIDLMKKARPIGLARLVLTERTSSPAELTPNHVLFVSKLLRTYRDGDDQNYTVARYLWSLRNTPGFSSVQPWWFLFLPTGVLARCMWAVGSRTMKLSDFMAKHAPDLATIKEKQKQYKNKDKNDWFLFGDDGDLSMDLNYRESLILTSIADPSFPGRVKIVRRLKSKPVNDGAAHVAEGMTNVPTAFTKPLPGVPGPRNVILPVYQKSVKRKTAMGKEYSVTDTFHHGHTILGWNFVYVREDFDDPDKLRNLEGQALDYFREG